MPVAKLPVEPFGTAEQASILVGAMGTFCFFHLAEKAECPQFKLWERL